MGLISVSDCPLCNKGYYCPHNGTVLATRLCLAGYFCPSGTADPASNRTLLCPAGSYCPLGSSVPIACDAGSYQDETGQSSCKTCPAGSVCVSGTVTPSECPRGSWCSSGTRLGTEYLCPKGTYGNRTSLSEESECTACDAGQYCGSLGLSSPSGACLAGYFCGSGSPVSTPFKNNGTVSASASLSVGSRSPLSSYHVSYVGETCVALSDSNVTTNDICPPGICWFA